MIVHPSPTSSATLALGLGILVSMIARRFKVPPLLPLLVTGALLGIGGAGVIDAGQLGDTLSSVAAIAVSALIFEGTLHLDRATLNRSPRAVRGLLTVGVAVTWLGTSAAAVYILGMSWPVSAVVGAILTVTGPTVIQPLLKRVRLTPNLHAAMLSEGILIDPIGVIAAVATLEIVLVYRELTGAENLLDLSWLYAAPFIYGTLFGGAFGLLIAKILKRPIWHGRAGDEAFVLTAITGFGLAIGGAELMRHESGLVASAIYGLIIARQVRNRLVVLRRVMESLATVLVGFLFVLLSSRIELSDFSRLDWREGVFVAMAMFLIRPTSVFIATARSALKYRERTYLALVAPRGIVAIATAAVTAEAFRASGTPAAEATSDRFELIILLVVVASVLWTSVVGEGLATFLKVRGSPASGLLIVGANRFGRDLARAIQSLKVPVRLIDMRVDYITSAIYEGLDATIGDATDSRWLDEEVASPEFGWLIAVTGNKDVDAMAARWGSEHFGIGRGLTWPLTPTPKPAPDGDEPEPTPAEPPAPGSPSINTDFTRILRDLESGRLAVKLAESPRELRMPLASVLAGRLTIPPPPTPAAPPQPAQSTGEPSASAPSVAATGTKKAIIVGLADSAPKPAPIA